MVNEKGCTVNTIATNSEVDEETMIPYSRVLYIAWDKDVGIRLQTIRNAKGISQSQLAKLTNGAVSKQTIVSLEVGRRNAVSREKLDILLASLGSDVRSLFPTVTMCLPV